MSEDQEYPWQEPEGQYKKLRNAIVRRINEIDASEHS